MSQKQACINIEHRIYTAYIAPQNMSRARDNRFIAGRHPIYRLFWHLPDEPEQLRVAGVDDGPPGPASGRGEEGLGLTGMFPRIRMFGSPRSMLMPGVTRSNCAAKQKRAGTFHAVASPRPPAQSPRSAFVAWQSGNGALANVALDRALADNPDYSMARLLRQAIDSGAPPSMARLPMTPEEVAASYDECADCEDGREPCRGDGQDDRPDGQPEEQDADGSGVAAGKAAEPA
jgi:hypothetical protein